MPQRHVERVLPYTPDQLFQLVGDVRRYPEFVPWILDLTATRPVERPDGANQLSAEARVGFSVVRETFATRVVRDPNARVIDVSLIRGPFHNLTNRWAFELHPDGTKVIFDIDFEFKTRFLEAILAANLERAVEKLINCFETRAQALYGPGVAPDGQS